MDTLKLFTTLNDTLMAHLKLDLKLYKMFSEKFFDELGVYPIQDGLVNSMLQLSTGEEGMLEFNDKFDSPGGTRGKKPISWDTTAPMSYGPDYIESLIRNKELSAKDKLAKIQAVYEKCAIAKQQFEKNAKKQTKKA